MAETYRVIIQPEAYAGMESGYAYIEQEAPESAQQWAIGLMNAIASLESFPTRCASGSERVSPWRNVKWVPGALCVCVMCRTKLDHVA